MREAVHCSTAIERLAVVAVEMYECSIVGIFVVSFLLTACSLSATESRLGVEQQ